MTQPDEKMQRYCDALEAFSEATVDDILALCSPSIEFRDPFNHTFTRDDFRRALLHSMKSIQSVGFRIDDRWGAGQSWVIKWLFSGRSKLIGDLAIPGLSEITLDEAGLVVRHIDYWDASEHLLQRVPVFGAATRAVLRPLRIG